MTANQFQQRKQVHQRLDQFLPWLVGFAFLALYTVTLAPSIVELFDDTLEFQLVLPGFGIAHPTGYPLYTMAGGFWNWLLPVGSWAWRANLLSATTAAATVALLFVLAGRMTRDHSSHQNHWAGLTAAILYGLGPVWWRQATVAEVYALHNLLLVAILLTAISLEGLLGARFDRRMALLWLLIGLALAHHRTTVLLLPGLAIYLLWSVPDVWRPRRVWLLWLVALVAPLLLYIYIPLRAAAGVSDLNGSYVNSWDGFWDHVLARRYTSFFADNDLSRHYAASDWLTLWLTQTGWLGALLSLAGLGNLADRRRRKAWLLILLVLAANLLFALVYRVGDPEVFLLPVFLCAAVLAGGGLALLQRQFHSQRWQVMVGVLSLLLLLWGAGRGPVVNRSSTWAAHDYAVDMAKVDFPPNSRVIGLEGEITALKYMQQAEGLGMAATPIVANPADERRAALQAAVAAGAPAYLTRELDGIAPQFSFTGEGPLVRAWPRGQVAEETPTTSADLLLLDGRLALEGYDLQRLQWAGGPVLRLTLFWRPLAAMTNNLKVSLRVIDASGAVLALPDGNAAVLDAFPLRQVAPTSTWPVDIQVRDVYEIGEPPNEGRLLVIVYDGDSLAEVARLEAPLPPRS